MARRTTRKTTRRPAQGRRGLARRAQRFQLRWFHLIIGCIGAFFLGYLVAAAQITSYAAAVFSGS